MYINQNGLKEFLDLVINLDNTMIESNVRMSRIEKTLSADKLEVELYKNVELIYNCIVDLILYYNRNADKLSYYKSDYEKLIRSWDKFVSNPASPSELGRKLQIVKDNSALLILKLKSNVN